MAAQLPDVINPLSDIPTGDSTPNGVVLSDSDIPDAPPMDSSDDPTDTTPTAPPIDTPIFTVADGVLVTPSIISPSDATPKAPNQDVTAIVVSVPYQRVRTPLQIAKEKIKKEILEIARQCENNIDRMVEQIEIRRQTLKKKIGDRLDELNKGLTAIEERKRLLSDEFENMQAILKEKQDLKAKYQNTPTLAESFTQQETEWKKKIEEFGYTKKMELLEIEAKIVAKSIAEFEEQFQQKHGQTVESVELERRLYEDCFTEWKVTSNKRTKSATKTGVAPKVSVKKGDEELNADQTKFGKKSIYTEEETLRLALVLLTPKEQMESVSTQQSILFNKLSSCVDRLLGESAKVNLIRDLQARHSGLGIESNYTVRAIVKEILSYDIVEAHKKRKEEEARLQQAEKDAEQTAEIEDSESQSSPDVPEATPSQIEVKTKSEKVKIVKTVQAPSIGEAQALLAATILKDVRAAVAELESIIKEAGALIETADRHQYQLHKPEQEIELAKILFKNLLNVKEVVTPQAAIAEGKLGSITSAEAFRDAQVALGNIQSIMSKPREQFQQIKAILPFINEAIGDVEKANMGHLQAAATALAELTATITEAEEAIKTSQARDLTGFSKEMSTLNIALSNLLAARQIIVAEVEGIKESVRTCASAGSAKAEQHVKNIQSMLLLVNSNRKKIKEVLSETEVRCIQNLNVAREKLHEIDEMIDKAQNIIQKLRLQKPLDFETKVGIAKIALKHLQESQQAIVKEVTTIQRCPRDLHGLSISSMAMLNIDSRLRQARQDLQSVQTNEKFLVPPSASKVFLSPMRMQLSRVQKQLDLMPLPLSFGDEGARAPTMTLSYQQKGAALVSSSTSKIERSSPAPSVVKE